MCGDYTNDEGLLIKRYGGGQVPHYGGCGGGTDNDDDEKSRAR